MIEVLIKFWDKLSQIGIRQYLKTERQQKVILVNRAGFISALLNILLLMLLQDVLFAIHFFYVAFSFLFLYLFTLVLNRLKLYYLAAIYLFILYAIHIFAFSSTFGYESNVHFLYVITLFAIVMGFGITNRSLLVTLVSIPILCLILLYITDFSLLKPDFMPANAVNFANLIVTIGSIGIIVILSYMYVSIIEKNNKRLKAEIVNREKNEYLVRQKDQLLHAINHNIREGIFRSSVAKGAIYINQAYAKMFGYPNIEEVLKIPFKDLYANDTDRIRLLSNLSKNKNIDNEEILFKRKDGSTFWGLVSAILTKDDDGDEYFFDGTVRDITELKNIQFQLEKAKQIAEQSSLDKSQFLSSMSHEIRTPLNAIIGLTHLLSEEDPKPEQIENLSTLSFSAQNLLVLINDILDFNKIEAGKIVFEKIDFNLENLLKKIKHGFQIAASENKNTITLRTDELIPKYIKGDPTRLSQILTNLVGNSVKFTQNGEINITTKLVEKTDKEAVIFFSVTDTGIGIPKEKQDFIFDRFTQATAETTRKYGGTGLGLAITKRLLEMQNSKIELESEVGKGTVFSFVIRFQYSDKKEDTANKPTQNSFEPFEKQRILVVEDNLGNQLVAKKFLTKWGLTVTIAEDGLIALDKLNSEDFDLVLMDIQMPNMDGYEATKAIRGIEKYKDLPIIALTASINSGVSQKALGAGMNDHVLKPFEPVQLYEKIAFWLRKIKNH